MINYNILQIKYDELYLILYVKLCSWQMFV